MPILFDSNFSDNAVNPFTNEVNKPTGVPAKDFSTEMEGEGGGDKKKPEKVMGEQIIMTSFEDAKKIDEECEKNRKKMEEFTS